MTPEASTPRRNLAAIVMVDVSGYSRMMGRNEEQTTALIREFHDHPEPRRNASGARRRQRG